MTSTRHLVLVGLMASGKTTVGQTLAARLGRPFVDNDVVLERRTGRSAREIAAADGATDRTWISARYRAARAAVLSNNSFT